MSGYTPIFDSVYAGSLCGKWPTTAVWVTLLPLCDKNGHIDLSYQAICALTGWPLDLLKQGIEELLRPDPDSRSDVEDGRRLVPIDPGRTWGWKVVNHGLYREKARKMAFDQARVADGRNADRLRERRQTRDDPTRPAMTRRDPPSNANTDSNKEKNQSKRALRASRVPEDFFPDLDLARKTLPGVDAEREAQKFRDWEFKTPRSDWVAAWRNWVQRCLERGEYARAPVVNGERPLSERYPGYKF